MPYLRPDRPGEPAGGRCEPLLLDAAPDIWAARGGSSRAAARNALAWAKAAAAVTVGPPV
eukprot:3973959-Pyramimonas_sp.AAC.1